MKKMTSGKKIGLGILGLLIIIIGLNFHQIKFALNMLRLYNEEPGTEVSEDHGRVEEETPNPLDLILEGPDPIDQVTVDEEDEDPTPDNQAEASGEDKIEEVKNPKNPKPEKKAYKEIVQVYNVELENLRNTFEADLDALVARGKAEYKKGDASDLQLGRKYLNLGTQLERDSDKLFNAKIKEMEKDLKAHGHSTEVLKDIRSYYNSTKETKKKALIDRGMSVLD